MPKQRMYADAPLSNAIGETERGEPMTDEKKRRARPQQQELVQVDSPDDMPYEGDDPSEHARTTGRAETTVVIDNPDDAEL